jgi:hypothetical protein
MEMEKYDVGNTMEKSDIDVALSKLIKMFPTGKIISVVNYDASEFSELKNEIEIMNISDVGGPKETIELIKGVFFEHKKSVLVCYPNGTTKWDNEQRYRIPIHSLAATIWANRTVWLVGTKNPPSVPGGF